MDLIRQFCAGIRLIFVGFVCLSQSYGAIAGETTELNEKLLKAIARNDLSEVQWYIAKGASPDASNAIGLSAIDIAVDNGYYDVAHFLIEAHKKNLQTIPLTINKKFLNSDSPSIIDNVSNFFKFESSGGPAKNNALALSVTPKVSVLNSPDSSLNLFTKLTDLILDFLPNGSNEPPQLLKGVEQPQSFNTKGLDDKKVNYPVIDFTKFTKDPYKVEKIVQTQIPALTLTLDKENTSYFTKDKPVDTLTLPKAMPRKLQQSELLFGGRRRLGDMFKAADVNEENCIIKSSWKSYFCIEAFNWPLPIQKVIGTFGGISGNGYSIVHYLNGKSVQFHGLFPSQSFGIVASLLTSYLGAPTDTPKIMTPMLAAAEVPNRIFQWVASAIVDQPPLILEIREIDDLRWSLPPDPLNGVIRMYWKGEPSVFKILTAADLLLLQIRNGGLQKTLTEKEP